METSITSETISQQTICGDNKGLNADMETNKELIKFEQKQNQLSKARIFTLNTFHHREWPKQKQP